MFISIPTEKQRIKQLAETLMHIEACNLLHDIDPVYYSEQRGAYTEQYLSIMEDIAKAFNNDTPVPSSMFDRVANVTRPVKHPL